MCSSTRRSAPLRDVARPPVWTAARAEEGHALVGVFESTMPPGGGFPFAHVHDEYEEVFDVLAAGLDVAHRPLALRPHVVDAAGLASGAVKG